MFDELRRTVGFGLVVPPERTLETDGALNTIWLKDLSEPVPVWATNFSPHQVIVSVYRGEQRLARCELQPYDSAHEDLDDGEPIPSRVHLLNLEAGVGSSDELPAALLNEGPVLLRTTYEYDEGLLECSTTYRLAENGARRASA